MVRTTQSLCRGRRAARTRRLFLLGGLIAGGAWAGPDEARAAVSEPRIHEIRVISPPEPSCYHGWPTVARRRNGELVAVWSGGRDAHVCPFGRLEFMVSRDEGRHWSWPRVLHDSAIDDRDGGIMETARGTLLATTFGSVAFAVEANRTRYAQAPERWQRFEAGGTPEMWAAEAGPRILRSVDGGRNWSAAARVPMNSPHGPVQLQDGRLLVVGVEGVGRGSGLPAEERRVGAWQSVDDGLTWSWLAAIPPRAGESTADYHELHAVEAANGTLVAMIRSHADNARRQMLQTESRDGGRTWSPPRAFGLFGYPPHLLRLRDGRLLLSYDHRREPFGVHARVSADHGATWSAPLAVTAPVRKLDQGYPSTVELSDRSLLTLWYEVPPGSSKAVLKQARWELPASP